MEIRFDILRHERGADTSYRQSILYEPEGENETVALALSRINRQESITDLNGAKVNPIRWECSCMQKKCGACAMVINNVPRLACDAYLKEFPKGIIELRPLGKFPAVEDLIVDRSVMFENLRTLGVWLEDKVTAGGSDDAYDASRCLQCGCCLEVCPNFMAGGKFFGMAAAVSASKVIAQVSSKRLDKGYDKHFYEGCGKSLACKGVCPAGIETDRLMVNSNAAAVWKRLFRR